MADSGYMSQAPSSVKIMSVPDTIQLSSDPHKTTSSKPVQQRDYRPMKVPDKITLNKTSSGGGEGTSGGGDVGVTHIPVPQSGLIISGQRFEAVNETTSIPPVVDSDVLPRGLPDTELYQRVQRLENRLHHVENRLGEMGVASPGASQFWYVVTFSSWMMVPLIAIFLIYYKRHA